MSFLKSLFGGGGKPKTELFTPPPPPTADTLARAESDLSISFPASFVSFMRESRAMELPPCAVFYWVGEESLGAGHIVVANRREREEAGVPLPHFLVAFYNDGMGNQVCFDTRRCDGGEYPIVFWDHELEAEENIAASVHPSRTSESAGIVAASFPEWLKSLREKCP
jgi:hypothetical protein